MPKASRETASETIALEGLEVQVQHFDGGYYVPPGHTPVHYAGAEIVEFSPTDVLAQTIPVVMDNLQATAARHRG